MNEEIPKFDLPVDYLIMSDITGELLNQYGRFPCKIKAGLFILCTQGTIKATINLAEYTVKSYDFITLVPDCFIQIHEASPDIQLYVAGFSSQFIANFNFVAVTQNLQPVILENPVISLSPDSASSFEDVYTAFIRAYNNKPSVMNTEIIKAILMLFTHGVCELYKQHSTWQASSATREEEICRNFVQLMMKEYRREHSVAYYAQKLGLTLPYFCNCIKKAAGRTPLDIITATLIMDAKAQLKSSTLSIKEISLILGFENAAFFSKFFKRYTEMTPNEYRRRS